jgi:hypothetical protein
MPPRGIDCQLSPWTPRHRSVPYPAISLADWVQTVRPSQETLISRGLTATVSFRQGGSAAGRAGPLKGSRIMLLTSD